MYEAAIKGTNLRATFSKYAEAEAWAIKNDAGRGYTIRSLICSLGY